jgi:exosortase A-associated hydrolase 1
MTGSGDEMPMTFTCAGDALIGVLHRPASVASAGMVIVVGGPQYRVGSHRQFVLLARALAARGIAVLRFDCRGMGDSAGEFPGFENIQPDIAAACDALMRHVPSLRSLSLWGLCDATLAICTQARRDARISGVVLVNPWVRSEAGYARTQLRHYYLARLTQLDFLRKALTGQFNPIRSGRALLKNISAAFIGGGKQRGRGDDAGSNRLAESMAMDLRGYRGRTLVILSGRDLTAKEFADAAQGSSRWLEIFADQRMTRREFAAADHTFSRREWRDQVADWTLAWLRG